MLRCARRSCSLLAYKHEAVETIEEDRFDRQAMHGGELPHTTVAPDSVSLQQRVPFFWREVPRRTGRPGAFHAARADSESCSNAGAEFGGEGHLGAFFMR